MPGYASGRVLDGERLAAPDPMGLTLTTVTPRRDERISHALDHGEVTLPIHGHVECKVCLTCPACGHRASTPDGLRRHRGRLHRQVVA